MSDFGPHCICKLTIAHKSLAYAVLNKAEKTTTRSMSRKDTPPKNSKGVEGGNSTSMQPSNKLRQS